MCNYWIKSCVVKREAFYSFLQTFLLGHYRWKVYRVMSLSLWLWQERRQPESQVIHQNMSVFAHLSVIRIATIPITSHNYLRMKKKKSFGNFLRAVTPSNWETIHKQEARNISYEARNISVWGTQYICLRHTIHLFEARNISVWGTQYICMRHAIYIYTYTRHAIYMYETRNIYVRDTQYICTRHAIYMYETRNIYVRDTQYIFIHDLRQP